MFEDIRSRRDQGAVVTGNYLLTKAKEIARDRSFHQFQGKLKYKLKLEFIYIYTIIYLYNKGSRGWLFNFLKRKNLVLRRVTSGGKQLPLNTKQIISDFHDLCKIKRVGLSRASVFNFDETSVQLDQPGNYTYDTKGKQNVFGATAGHERVKVSVCLTTSADGTILPAFIIIPRKTPLPDYVPPHNVVVHYKPSGKTFDSTIIKKGVLKRVLMPHIMQQEIEKPLVLVGSCH